MLDVHEPCRVVSSLWRIRRQRAAGPSQQRLEICKESESRLRFSWSIRANRMLLLTHSMEILRAPAEAQSVAFPIRVQPSSEYRHRAHRPENLIPFNLRLASRLAALFRFVNHALHGVFLWEVRIRL